MAYFTEPMAEEFRKALEEALEEIDRKKKKSPKSEKKN